MTLTQLKYILAVERCQNFAQAARECYVTQPTLSMQIHKLEDYLQVVIFDRDASPTRPTSLGLKVLAMAKEVVRRADALEDLAKAVRKEVAGEFNLAVIPTMAPYLVPLFVEKFRERYPKVILRIYEHETKEILTLLKEDRMDAALCATPLETKGLKEEVLFYEPFQLLFSPDHELLKKKEISESDLKLEDAWLLQEGHCLRTQVLQLCKMNANAHPGFHFESGSIETLVNLLRQTHGFTVIPELAVDYLAPEDKKRLRVFKGKRPVREVSLVTGPFTVKASITEAIAKEIKKLVPKEMTGPSKSHLVLEPG